MQDQPGISELLEAVRDFIRDEAAPELRGRKQFLAKVAVNTLEIIGRQIRSELDMDASELQRLSALLNREGTLDELNRELCVRIRNGNFTPHDPNLLEHLWSTTLAKLSVDQPKYSTYRATINVEGGK